MPLLKQLPLLLALAAAAAFPPPRPPVPIPALAPLRADAPSLLLVGGLSSPALGVDARAPRLSWAAPPTIAAQAAFSIKIAFLSCVTDATCATHRRSASGDTQKARQPALPGIAKPPRASAESECAMSAPSAEGG